GSPVAGTVAELWVEEGDVVRRGQRLARIENDVAQAQVRQAAQALQTGRAGLAQAGAGPRGSGFNGAGAEVMQAARALQTANAQVAQAAAGPRASELNAAKAQVAQAESTVRQRQAQVAQSRAAVTQAEARRVLAQQNLDRNRLLFNEGAVSR